MEHKQKPESLRHKKIREKKMYFLEYRIRNVIEGAERIYV